MNATVIARERRHTLYFLDETRSCAPVFLDTDVDMSQVLKHRAQARRGGDQPCSVVTYVLHAAARVLTEHPDANAAVTGHVRPKVARYACVNGKLALDKTLNGRRVVMSAILPDLQGATLQEIQQQVAHYRDGDPAHMAEFARTRTLHRIPWALGPAAFRRAVRPLARRPAALGTFSVSSLGHRPVDGFHSVGGTTVTLGLGQIADRPVVREGQITVAPVMRLSLTFDHRVIDGAEAADVLAGIKDSLESCQQESAHADQQPTSETMA